MGSRYKRIQNHIKRSREKHKLVKEYNQAIREFIDHSSTIFDNNNNNSDKKV